MLSGSLHITMPFKPNAEARSTSATLCSMFHHGISAIGSSLPPESDWISAIASL